MLISPSGNPVWKVQKVCVAIRAQPFQLYDFAFLNDFCFENNIGLGLLVVVCRVFGCEIVQLVSEEVFEVLLAASLGLLFINADQVVSENA